MFLKIHSQTDVACLKKSIWMKDYIFPQIKTPISDRLLFFINYIITLLNV